MDDQQTDHPHDPSQQHDPHPATPVHHDMSRSQGMSGEKFTVNFSGIDWQQEVKNAIEILKLNKTKMHEVAKNEKANTVGLVFIILPSLLSLIIVVAAARGFIGWAHGSYIMQMISPFLFFYAVHFCATQFFQGKGNVVEFFRVVSYTYVIYLLIPVLVLLSFVSLTLAGLVGLVTIAAGIWALIVSYHILMETYHVTSANAILTLVIAIVAVGIIVSIVQNMLFPAPTLGDLMRLTPY